MKRIAVLLMGASKSDGQWKAMVETDSFIPAGSAVSITYLPKDDHGGMGIPLHDSFAILLEDETWRISVTTSGRLHMQSLEGNANGETVVVRNLGHELDLFTLSGEKVREQCSVPTRLCAWARADFPRTADQVRRFAEQHQPHLEAGQAYIGGVNFREKPTGKSRSMGAYSARVRVLGSQPGADVPWYNVQIGDTKGWVSGAYLTDGSDNHPRYYSMGATTLPIARVDADTPLRSSPNGEVKQTLAAGTKMHVVMNNDGWLHVIVPRGEIDWRIDWDGTYGYIREGEAVLGGTLDDLKYK